MLIIYEKPSGTIISHSIATDHRTGDMIIDTDMAPAEPLPENQAAIKIADLEIAGTLKEAFDRGDIVRVSVNEAGAITGIYMEEGSPKSASEPLPTLEERVRALEELELMRLFGGDG